MPHQEDAPAPVRAPRGRPAPASFHVLTKPTGAICNLDCDYCFFLAKEELYPGSTFRMTERVLETYISQLLAAHRTPEVTIAWQGGEPTMMGLDFYQHVMEIVDRHRRPRQVVEHTIQTNATLIDDAWAAFLAEHCGRCHRRPDRIGQVVAGLRHDHAGRVRSVEGQGARLNGLVVILPTLPGRASAR